MLHQIIQKRPHPRGQLSAMADEHGMDRFEIAGIEVFQHGHQTSCLDIRIDVKAGEARKARTGNR